MVSVYIKYASNVQEDCVGGDEFVRVEYFYHIDVTSSMVRPFCVIRM